ncbi:S9 family peptidase [Schaalia sp. 19OD2882]|uniref:prolyl oligopeptidase family serine peptidase n=1 Tax=Schaalia sp. 19OD2882 TaxID=2794089 RepID=UPI001C1EAC8A|nr:prolyl oligopeptidase family serine peptidase [Schaalia sp. 19OD2882]QWW19329.1 S9 family peptidase [Schaalia sp. 19OD2882]
MTQHFHTPSSYPAAGPGVAPPSSEGGCKTDDKHDPAQAWSKNHPAPAWLDEVDGRRAADWVRERNAETTAELESARRRDLERRILEVLQCPDRIPHVVVRGQWAYNFWTDAEHPRGLWRRQPVEDHLAHSDQWEVLVDVDALSRSQGRSLVWHGAQVLRPDLDRALVDLSEAGQDADETREFDLVTKQFLPAADPSAFSRPAARGGLGWIDRDHVWVSTDLGPGTTSSSGHPLQARIAVRGQALEDARVVVEGAPDDLGVFVGHDPTPGFERSVVRVAHDFLHSTTYLLSDPLDPEARPVALEVPTDASVSPWRRWLLVHPREDWEVSPGHVHRAGTLVAFDLEDFLEGGRIGQELFTPDAHTSLAGWSATRAHLVLTLTRDVVTHLVTCTPPESASEGATGAGRTASTGEDGANAATADLAGRWTCKDLTLPDLPDLDIPPLVTISARPVDPWAGNRLWLTVSGWTTPTTLLLLDLDAQSAQVSGARIIHRAPTLFDATGVEVSQHFATSTDGTRVPYFRVGRPGAVNAPTVLHAYGGFGHTLVPGYAATVGRALLEHGGTWVVANVRGGGEYGPAWHEAARGPTRKERSYEDVEAVARDLVATGVTTPSRLGVEGGSNGGLMAANMYVRCPDLFGAVVSQAPLIDMGRYHTLSAGSSWMAEYGDPDDPDQWEHMRRWSPMHLWDPGRSYPPILLTASTRDDRVHPAHARCFVHVLREGLTDALYVENVEGGHSGAADAPQQAWMSSLVWEFFWCTLT